MGPMTGRSAGYRAGFGIPGYADPAPSRGFGIGRGVSPSGSIADAEAGDRVPQGAGRVAPAAVGRHQPARRELWGGLTARGS